MRRRFGGCICVLLTAVLCAVLLTGCPNMSEEEWVQLKRDGREKLAQGLKEYYGWEEKDYKIVSESVTPKSAQGFNSGLYEVKKGDTDLTAFVDISRNEVFTDCYAKEFEEVLVAYLERKLENSPILEGMSLRITQVTFYPPRADGEKPLVIPISLTPDAFEAYLEECEKDGKLQVDLKVNWYSMEAKELPEDLLKELTPSDGQLLRCLIVNRYACEPEEETKRENLKQILTFYR